MPHPADFASLHNWSSLSLQASGKLKKVPTSLPWAQGTAQYIEIQNMLNNFTDDSYISQPISGATPPPADINITMDIILSPGSCHNQV